MTNLPVKIEPQPGEKPRRLGSQHHTDRAAIIFHLVIWAVMAVNVVVFGFVGEW